MVLKPGPKADLSPWCPRLWERLRILRLPYLFTPRAAPQDPLRHLLPTTVCGKATARTRGTGRGTWGSSSDWRLSHLREATVSWHRSRLREDVCQRRRGRPRGAAVSVCGAAAVFRALRGRRALNAVPGKFTSEKLKVKSQLLFIKLKFPEIISLFAETWSSISSGCKTTRNHRKTGQTQIN